MSPRDLRARIGAVRQDGIAGWALRLVGTASPDPPPDTRTVATEAAAILRAETPDAELPLHHAGDEALNVVARVRGPGTGRRVVLNGHPDSHPWRPVALGARPT